VKRDHSKSLEDHRGRLDRAERVQSAHAVAIAGQPTKADLSAVDSRMQAGFTQLTTLLSTFIEKTR
jgi:hypothetical protein